MIKCYDVADPVIQEATNRFIGFVENKGKKYLLMEICSCFDDLAEEFEGISYEVSVDEETLDITIIIECGEIIVEKLDHAFYKLLYAAKDARFAAGAEPDSIEISFKFDGIWDRR